jgi:hypothetical protein
VAVPEKAPSVGLTWGMAYAALFAYRSLVSVVGEVLIRRVTSIGDTGTYQSGVLEETYQTYLKDIFLSLTDVGSTGLATVLTVYVGRFFNFLFFGNPHLINIGFQSITFAGLVVLLQAIEPALRLRMYVLCMLPSFTLWTSIASKEAIIAGAVAVLSAYFIRLYSRRIAPGVHHVLAAIVLFLFKPHYGVVFAYGIGTTFVCTFVRRKALVALTLGLTSLLVLYLSWDQVIRYSFLVQRAFFEESDAGSAAVGGRSSREKFFLEDADVLLKAPEGMFKTFFGPTLSEVATSVLHLVTFVEGIVLAAVLVVLALHAIRRLPIYSAIVAGFMVFWTIFPNYPFGVMNPGTAIRYRSGWVLVILAVVAVFMSRRLFANWIGTVAQRQTTSTETGGVR